VSRPPLTWLYVPGDRPDRVAKALGSPADVVLVDLEDAVAAHAKVAARGSTADLLHDADPGRAVQVRVNAAGTPWHEEDVATVAALPRHVGLRLPKAESVGTVRDVSAAAPDRAIHLLVESALGLERAYDLATATSDVATVGLGEADLRADLGVIAEDGLVWARGRIVAAAAAAGLPPPAMAVFTNVRDLDGLAASCRVGRSLGFLGRTAIHPNQLDVIRAAFTPTPDEVARARDLLDAADLGSAAGRGAIALPDGRFVDAAVLRQARRVVALAG
jgi:citrate lyase subunit beta / citryl-CoA lyase